MVQTCPELTKFLPFSKYFLKIFLSCPFVQNWGEMKNGQWSDNWCLDGLTCMYTHHYPCMIDNISHLLCKPRFILFNAEKKCETHCCWSAFWVNQKLNACCIFLLRYWSSRMMVENVMQFFTNWESSPCILVCELTNQKDHQGTLLIMNESSEILAKENLYQGTFSIKEN